MQRGGCSNQFHSDPKSFKSFGEKEEGVHKGPLVKERGIPRLANEKFGQLANKWTSARSHQTVHFCAATAQRVPLKNANMKHWAHKNRP